MTTHDYEAEAMQVWLNLQRSRGGAQCQREKWSPQ